MALVEATLAKAIKEALEKNKSVGGNIQEDNSSADAIISSSIATLADDLAAAINTFVLSGDVSTIVTTTGSATKQEGTGTGKIS